MNMNIYYKHFDEVITNWCLDIFGEAPKDGSAEDLWWSLKALEKETNSRTGTYKGTPPEALRRHIIL